MNITSDKQIHIVRNFVGNECKSLKSCNCIAVEKSNSILDRLIHLFANSWRTVWVINSIGNSMYRKDGPKRIEINVNNVSKLVTCNPETSGRSETWVHNRESQAIIRHLRQTLATRPISRCGKYVNIFKTILSGNRSNDFERKTIWWIHRFYSKIIVYRSELPKLNILVMIWFLNICQSGWWYILSYGPHSLG